MTGQANIIRFLRIAISLPLLVPCYQRVEAQVLRGFTEPHETIRLATAEPGRVGEVSVKLGELVKPGQLILSLDNRVLDQSRKLAIAKASARGNIDFAHSEVNLKSNRLEKLKCVQSDGFAGVNEIEIAQTELATAQARLQAALDEQALHHLDVERIDAQLEQRQVRSPIEGVVIELNHKVGEYISISQPDTAVVVDLSKLRVKFYLLTEDAARLSAGQRINLRLEQDNRPLAGDIQYIAPVTSAGSSTVRVDVVIDNRRNQIRSGVVVRIELE